MSLMNKLLVHKYSLLSNIINDLLIPIEIHMYIMAIMYDFTYVNICTGLGNICIITNRGIYQKNNSWQLLNIIDSDIKYWNVKKFVYGHCFVLVLSHHGNLYLCRSNYNNISNCIHIATNVKDAFCLCLKIYYITSNDKLYGKKIKIDINRHIFSLDPNFVVNNVDISNYKECFQNSDGILILFNDGKLVLRQNDISIKLNNNISLPPFRNVALYFPYIAAITFNNELLILEYNHKLKVKYMVNNIGNIKMITSRDDKLFMLTYNGELYKYSITVDIYDREWTKDNTAGITRIDAPAIDQIHSIKSQLIAITPNGTLYEVIDSQNYKDNDFCKEIIF